MQLLGYDFAMLQDYGIVIPSSFTHDKLYPRRHSSAVASKLDLLRAKPHRSYAAYKLLRKDGFWDAVLLQDRDTFELHA